MLAISEGNILSSPYVITSNLLRLEMLFERRIKHSIPQGIWSSHCWICCRQLILFCSVLFVEVSFSILSIFNVG